ncbi:MAG: hypothetical protein M3Z54_10420 [Gemmatimonadota bacterium]|nr:hypothetical protein [Gemmatimonadota bacterium]
MLQQPQRPFVPHLTPKSSPQVVARSEFRLSKPFVPGSLRQEVAAATASAPVEAAAHQHQRREELPSIEAFLDMSSRPAEPQVVESRDEYSSDFTEDTTFPPVEHFLDPLPAVGHFAPDAAGALMEDFESTENYDATAPTNGAATETGWVEDDWQQYNWRAAARLGDGVEDEASNDWAATDWDVGAPPRRTDKPSAAQAIANALDQIAQRIREGDLSVPPHGALTDPAAIAATLAALLGVRR